MSAEQTHNPHLILSVGTRVVALTEVRRSDGTVAHPRGAAGEIIQAPADAWHAYRVLFLDGVEASFHRRELAVLRHHIAGDLIPAATAEPPAEHKLFDHVIYRCVIGSRAYGLEHDASDTDLRGVYLPPAALHWSLYGVPEQIDDPQTQETYWEFQKFLVLALKANPNVLECLYTPLVEHATELARE